MSESKVACVSFFFRARKRITGLIDGLDPFFYADGLKDVWTSFDAFLNYKGYTGNNTDKRAKFVIDFLSHFKIWYQPDDFKWGVKQLMILSPVENMDNGRKKPITNENDLKEILDFTYTVRSNLNHGSKDLLEVEAVGNRNRALVEQSFKTTYYVLEWVLVLEKLI